MDNLIYALGDLVGATCGILSFAIVIRAVLSWFQPDPSNPILRILARITDPIINPISSMLPHMGGLDLSPIIAIFALQMIQGVVIGMLYSFLG